MDPRAIAKAQSRLRLAKRAVEDLCAAENFDQFTDAWYTFLVTTKNIYTALEQGAKRSSEAKKWFDRKKTERNRDALLQYLFQARNDVEHGLGSVTERKPGFVQVVGNNITIDSIVGGRISGIRSLDGSPVRVFEQAPRVELIQVHNRGRAYDPPTRHLGNDIEGRQPEAVARLALAYFENLTAEAGRLAADAS